MIFTKDKVYSMEQQPQNQHTNPSVVTQKISTSRTENEYELDEVAEKRALGVLPRPHGGLTVENKLATSLDDE
jgi:hypothetical protein